MLPGELFNRNALSVAALLAALAATPCPAETPAAPAGERAVQGVDAQSLLSAFMSYTNLRLRGVQQVLEVLAASDEARSGNWKKMRPLLTAYQKSDGGLIVWFVRPDGTYYTPDEGRMAVKLSDRAYFPGLMAGERVMGALVISKATGQRSAIVAIPMRKDGKVFGAIGASLFLDKLAEQVDAALALRPEATFYALAPNALTTLNRRGELHFLDPREQGSETLKRATEEMLAHDSGETTYVFDNVTKTAIYRTSPLTGWKFVIAFSPPRK